MSKRQKRIIALLILIGFGTRFALVILAGNSVRAPWSGGGDSQAYICLANNILGGRGLSYAGLPTAFRPPMYPLLLAAAQLLFGTRYLLFVRLFQFLAAICAGWLCAMASRHVWGVNSTYVTLAFFSISPTLIFLNSEILTESLAVLMT